MLTQIQFELILCGVKNVLLVEDDEDIRDCLLEGIESSMYNVFSACDGIDALDKIKSLKIDLVITDYRMPRMNGGNVFN